MNNSYEILEIILQYIQKNNTTEKQSLIDCNINTSFLTDWKGGRLKNPSYDKIVKLAKYLSIDLNLLFLGEETKISLAEEENQLVSDFRSLSFQGKEYINHQMFIAKEIYKKQDISEADLNVG